MYTATLAAFAGLSLQGCKKNEDMASLVHQDKKDMNKKGAEPSKILEKFQKDVKDVPKVEGAFTDEQKKDLKVDQVNRDLQQIQNKLKKNDVEDQINEFVAAIQSRWAQFTFIPSGEAPVTPVTPGNLGTKPPPVVFLVDVSRNALESGMFEVVIASIRNIIERSVEISGANFSDTSLRCQ